MPLIKIQEGLLERDNFYLTSSFSDFLGNGTYAKSLGYFELKQGEIKRNFTYKEFVIEVIKDNKTLQKEESYSFFIEVLNKDGELKEIGLCETQGEANITHWRITCYENFIQTYISLDGVNWENTSGTKLIDMKIVYQGFKVKGETSLVFTDYRVYHNPFITLQNFEEDFKVELYSATDALIKTRLFDANMEAHIFIDNNVEGYFKVYDYTNNLIFTSQKYVLSMGGVYVYTPYELEMTYKGNVIGYGPTHLGKNLQLLQLKNIGTELYENLKVVHLKATSDKDIIELSLDGLTYTVSLNIASLALGEVQDIYVRITKDDVYDFMVNEFELRIY